MTLYVRLQVEKHSQVERPLGLPGPGVASKSSAQSPLPSAQTNGRTPAAPDDLWVQVNFRSHLTAYDASRL